MVVMADRVESLRSNTWASGGMEWPEQPDPSGQASPEDVSGRAVQANEQADLDVPSTSHILAWFWFGKMVGWLHEFRRMLDLAQNGRLLISPGHHGEKLPDDTLTSVASYSLSSLSLSAECYIG